jgi:hypothetical protein
MLRFLMKKNGPKMTRPFPKEEKGREEGRAWPGPFFFYNHEKVIVNTLQSI